MEREKDKNYEFPEGFWKALVEIGFTGIIIQKNTVEAEWECLK